MDVAGFGVKDVMVFVLIHLHQDADKICINKESISPYRKSLIPATNIVKRGKMSKWRFSVWTQLSTL